MTKEEENLFGIEKLNLARSDIPAVTHVDYSTRVQTVSETDNPAYYQLLKAYPPQTGNVKGYKPPVQDYKQQIPK